MKNSQEFAGLTHEKKILYTHAMATNLPMLRVRLGLTQRELGELIGVTRQTINALETQSRAMPWNTFLSLLFVFTQNEETSPLLPVVGIYTPELSRLFRVTDSSDLDALSAG